MLSGQNHWWRIPSGPYRHCAAFGGETGNGGGGETVVLEIGIGRGREALAAVPLAQADYIRTHAGYHDRGNWMGIQDYSNNILTFGS